MANSLERCPFDGGRARFTMFDGQHFVQCQSCGAATGGCSSKSVARRAWQQRVSDVLRQVRIARRALRLIAPERRCETFTTGIGSCFRNGRTVDAKYLAHRCCESRIAHDALDRMAGKKGLSVKKG